jgi:DNA-binding MarR family transcriptional regulator
VKKRRVYHAGVPQKPLRLVPAVHRATHRIGLYLSGLTGDRLSQGEAHILAHLAVSGPAPIADLNRGLAHKRSTLTSILDRLTARGLVRRAVGKTDRRTFVITLTPRGQSVARQVHGQLASLEAAIAKAVPARTLDALIHLLESLEVEAHARARRRR